MKNIARNVLTLVPPTALFLIGFVGAMSFGLVKLYGMLQAAGLEVASQ
tara:strand:+ start:36155 stop:36298 length:144 start_codon:yes stop_codon:yes gene_type:complete